MCNAGLRSSSPFVLNSTFVCIVISAILATIIVPPVMAATIIVPDQAPTVSAGINMATSGDTVLVRPGTYTENLDLGGKEILLLAEQGPAATTIFGASDAPTIRIQNGEGRSLIIDGFTITGADNGEYANRRGIEILSGSPIIRHNIIRDNKLPGYAQGCAGGIFASGASSPWIEGNIIRGNNASVTSPETNTGLGGGICLCATATLPIPAVIKGNTLSDNSVSNYDFVVNARGGGIYAETLRPEDCVIEGNTVFRNKATGESSAAGGGIYATCEVRDNWVELNCCTSSGDGDVRGGGICLLAGAARRNVVTRNSAESSSSWWAANPSSRCAPMAPARTRPFRPLWMRPGVASRSSSRTASTPAKATGMCSPSANQ